ncbi:hypothetical protein HYH02_014382 [Chlamydomonas schloesseri]|uniref:Uncharacterized protein n=1 Tax=Chlamydomonas schloesseri TaxID=2026947 RepID=A0A835VUI1_9CHLO|nr:hypothetical protein HYH02_014382 [Chlamydomonas schloesseri]|eukprot:KAG2428395.1 hypothetical protein HYH02_014382 [Chlamydomonas schloesseri]
MDQQFALRDAEIAANAQQIANVQKQLEELKAVVDELSAKVARSAGAPATPAAEQHFRTDELRLKVKPEDVASIGTIIQDTVQAERPGAHVQFSVRPIQPKRGQQAGAQAGAGAAGFVLAY